MIDHFSKTSLLEESVKPIGKRNVEIRQQICSNSTQKKLHYLVESWLFLPRSLQINRMVYEPKNFQQRLKNYVRFAPLSQKLDYTKSHEESKVLLTETLFSLNKAIRYRSVESRAEYEENLKKFCIAYRSMLSQKKNTISQLSNKDEKIAEMLLFVKNISCYLRLYRKLLSEKALQIRSKMRAPTFLFCDEYLRIATVQTITEMLRTLPTDPALKKIQAFIHGQMAYRRKYYPDTVPTEGSDNELPIFRWSILKKYIDMPMFLDIQPRQGYSILVHSIYGVAAAAAMIFATAIAFVWQDWYGALSAQLFISLVIAYIFKDRIKEIFRDHLFSLFRRWLPDRELFIFDNRGHKLGNCKESSRFEVWKKLPKDVRELRNKTHFIDILNAFHNEDILYSSKEILLKTIPKIFSEQQPLLVDISRFDISDFLRHADEVLNEPQGGTTVEEKPFPGEKVYHVDLIRKTTTKGKTILNRYRIVLTYAGIRRINHLIMPSLDTLE